MSCRRCVIALKTSTPVPCNIVDNQYAANPIGVLYHALAITR